MTLYQFKFVRGDDTISDTAHCFKDDLDALDEARRRTKEFDVQIWQGDQKVARVKRGNAPLNERDLAGN